MTSDHENALIRLRNAWEDLIEATRVLFDAQWPVPPHLFERWDRAHAVAHDLYLQLRPKQDPMTVVTDSRGSKVKIQPFSLVLSETPNARWLRGSTLDGRRHLFEQGLALGRSLIRSMQLGSGDSESQVETLCNQLGFSAGSRLSEVRTRLAEGEHRDAIGGARRALERLATEMANRFSPLGERRRFADAMDILVQRQILTKDTAAFIRTPNVGLWGWMSQIAVHDEDGGQTVREPGLSEAQLALAATEAAMGLLLNGYTQVTSTREDDPD